MNEPTDFEVDQRVITPQGPGKVVYKRYNGSEVHVYSVALDYRVLESVKPPFPHYKGTVFPAREVVAQTTPLACSQCKEVKLNVKIRDFGEGLTLPACDACVSA